MHSILQPHLSMSLFFQVLMTKSDTKSTCFENYTVITKKENNSNPTFYNKLINSFSSSPNSRRMNFFFFSFNILYCISHFTSFFCSVTSPRNNTLLRQAHWPHWQAPQDLALAFCSCLRVSLWLSYRHTVWASLSSVQHTVYAKVRFTLYYAFGCAILHFCYQFSKLIPVVSLEFFVFLLAQSPKAFQDIHTEPKEVGFLSQDYSYSVWCNVKSWLYN